MHRRSYLLWPPVIALSSGSTLRIGGIRHYCCRGILLLFIINIVPGIYLFFFYVRTPGSLKIQDPVRVESNILLNTAASAAVRGRRVLSLLRISLPLLNKGSQSTPPSLPPLDNPRLSTRPHAQERPAQKENAGIYFGHPAYF